MTKRFVFGLGFAMVLLGASLASAEPSSVAPTRLKADRQACPANYASTSPKSGLNPTFEVAGQKRSFWLMLPDATKHKGPRPLFLALHGTSEDGKGFVQRARLKAFTDRGFVVIAPSSVGNGTLWPVWDGMRLPTQTNAPNKDLAFFDALLGCAASHFELDAKRLYVGGHSAGGIMTNAVLQRRAQVFAGGIVGSGVFSLTSPPRAKPMDATFALVVWGGDSDVWSGRAGPLAVSGFSFVEQASLASQFYTKQPAVEQMYCTSPIGHAWPSRLNNWMIDRLLERPKGYQRSSALKLPPPPSDAKATCSAKAFVSAPELHVECPTSQVSGCQEACQLFGDCAAENGTVRHVWSRQLAAMGFKGASCSGCVARCEKGATTAKDREVLACMKKGSSQARCGPGVEGALPMAAVFNACCGGASGDSTICRGTCQIMGSNSTAKMFFTACSMR